MADTNIYIRWPKRVRFLTVGRHYNARLFKLSRPKRRRNTTNFPLLKQVSSHSTSSVFTYAVLVPLPSQGCCNEPMTLWWVHSGRWVDCHRWPWNGPGTTLGALQEANIGALHLELLPTAISDSRKSLRHCSQRCCRQRRFPHLFA